MGIVNKEGLLLMCKSMYNRCKFIFKAEGSSIKY